MVNEKIKMRIRRNQKKREHCHQHQYFSMFEFESEYILQPGLNPCLQLRLWPDCRSCMRCMYLEDCRLTGPWKLRIPTDIAIMRPRWAEPKDRMIQQFHLLHIEQKSGTFIRLARLAWDALPLVSAFWFWRKVRKHCNGRFLNAHDCRIVLTNESGNLIPSLWPGILKVIFFDQLSPQIKAPDIDLRCHCCHCSCSSHLQWMSWRWAAGHSSAKSTQCGSRKHRGAATASSITFLQQWRTQTAQMAQMSQHTCLLAACTLPQGNRGPTSQSENHQWKEVPKFTSLLPEGLASCTMLQKWNMRFTVGVWELELFMRLAVLMGHSCKKVHVASSVDVCCCSTWSFKSCLQSHISREPVAAQVFILELQELHLHPFFGPAKIESGMVRMLVILVQDETCLAVDWTEYICLLEPLHWIHKHAEKYQSGGHTFVIFRSYLSLSSDPRSPSSGPADQRWCKCGRGSLQLPKPAEAIFK